MERLRISLKRYFDFVESHAAGYAALLRGGPADRSGEAGEIVDGIRQLLLDRILHSLDVEVPPPVLRITLRCWMAVVETAYLDWLENRDVPRPELELLLVDQLVAIMQTAYGTRSGHRRPVRAPLPGGVEQVTPGAAGGTCPVVDD